MKVTYFKKKSKEAKKAWRRSGLLKRLQRVTYPDAFVFFDTETKAKMRDDAKNIQELRLGVANYILRDKQFNVKKEQELIFYSNIEFFEFLESHCHKRRKLHVFAHNIAFDLMVTGIFHHYHEQGYDLSPPIHAGFRFIWTFKHELGTMVFINTGNYINTKLENIGVDLGYEKLTIDFHTATDDELVTYCKRDVLIIELFIFRLMDFLRDNSLGGFRMTIASLSLSVYRYAFMPDEIVIHENLIVNHMERLAYKGGRTECLHYGDVPESPIYALDINSMYPHVMVADPLPCELITAYRTPSIQLLRELADDHYLLGFCTINPNEPFYGLRWDKNKYKINEDIEAPKYPKLIFPRGTFTDYLHHDELMYAIDNDYLVKCHTVVLYRKSNLFGSYVNFFSEQKERYSLEGNRTYRQFTKLFLNSLYGKFGQRFRDTMLVEKNRNLPYSPIDSIHLESGETSIYFNWFDDIYLEYSNGESAHSFPIIAGAITARARMLLWEYMKIGGLENVYYCDTDSLYVNEQGKQNLRHKLDDHKQGFLELQGTYQSLTLHGAKNYIKDGQKVVKGVPVNADWFNDHVSISTQFEGFKTWLHHAENRPPLVWKQLKIMTGKYDKAVVHEDGTIKPYTITDLLDV